MRYSDTDKEIRTVVCFLLIELLLLSQTRYFCALGEKTLCKVLILRQLQKRRPVIEQRWCIFTRKKKNVWLARKMLQKKKSALNFYQCINLNKVEDLGFLFILFFFCHDFCPHVFYKLPIWHETTVRNVSVSVAPPPPPEQRRRFLGEGLQQAWKIHRVPVHQEWWVSKISTSKLSSPLLLCHICAPLAAGFTRVWTYQKNILSWKRKQRDTPEERCKLFMQNVNTSPARSVFFSL